MPRIDDLAKALIGQPVAPFDAYKKSRGVLHLVGRAGLSLIVVSALDMAARDALAQAANMPLAVCLGGTAAPGRCRPTTAAACG